MKARRDLRDSGCIGYQEPVNMDYWDGSNTRSPRRLRSVWYSDNVNEIQKVLRGDVRDSRGPKPKRSMDYE